MYGVPRIDYLHWIEDRASAATHDLASTDLDPDPDPSPGVDRTATVVPDRLSGLSDPDPDESLREMVAGAYGVSPDRVVVTGGATMANVLAVGAALSAATDRDPGDFPAEPTGPRPRVLVEKPGYEPLRATPRAFGARIDRFLRPSDEGYRLSPDRVAAAATEDTALVTVTNRHNPSGRLSVRERLARTAARAQAVEAPLLVDEAYAPYAVDEQAGRSAFGGVTAAGVDNAVVTGSLTKFYGLGGLRVGWLIADRAFATLARRVAMHFPGPATPSRGLARRALANRESLGDGARELLARNADLLSSFVGNHADLLGPVFEGSSYAFLEHASVGGDAVVEAAADRDLLVVPGRFFDDDDRFRMSLGRPTETVEAGLDALDEALASL